MSAIENKYKYLKFSSLIDTKFWDYYTLSHKDVILSHYQLVKLSEVIKLRKEFISINDDILYKRCRVQIQGKGVVLRDEVLGKEIKTKKQQVCKKDDFLVAEIDAKVGGYGIVPAELEDAIVSGHYFLFEINILKLLPNFLGLVIKQTQFSKQVKSTGSTNYAAIRPYHVLDYQIPLPSLKVQEKYVASYNEKIQKAKNLKVKAKNLQETISNYLFTELGITNQVGFEFKKGLNFIEYVNLTKWALSHLYKNNQNIFVNSKYKTKKIKDLLVFFEGGKTPSKSRNDFWNGEIFWTSPKDFNGQSIIDSAEDRITHLAVEETGIKVFPKGVFLSVFRSGILQHSFPTAITEIETAINQDLKAYSLKEDLIDRYYYLHFVHVFKKYILSNSSKKSVTVESINTEDFMELQIPLPPLTIQKKISEHINNLISESKKMQIIANEIEIQSQQEFENEIFLIP